MDEGADFWHHEYLVELLYMLLVGILGLFYSNLKVRNSQEMKGQVKTRPWLQITSNGRFRGGGGVISQTLCLSFVAAISLLIERIKNPRFWDSDHLPKVVKIQKTKKRTNVFTPKK